MLDLKNGAISRSFFGPIQSCREHAATIQTATVPWRTPGRDLAQTIAGIDEVVLVAERIEKDANSIVVVLKKDPDTVLDAIFNAEQDLHCSYPKTPFSLRVMTPSADWSQRDLRRDYVALFDRQAVE